MSRTSDLEAEVVQLRNEVQTYRKREIEEKDALILALQQQVCLLQQDLANVKKIAEQRYDTCMELQRIYDETVRGLREKASAGERFENARKIIRETKPGTN